MISLAQAENVYVDPRFGRRTLKITQGEFGVVTGSDVLVTTLGSCVAACIRDRRLGIGGMNHFMLPGTDEQRRDGAAARYGLYAMELLINDLLSAGCDRLNLEAKLFGAASMIGDDVLRVGKRNAEFARSFLEREGIAVENSDLGGQTARKVYYFPDSGKALVRYLRRLHNDTLLERELSYKRRLEQEKLAGETELFSPG